jgi:DNA-binding MarR family transcriptional regulator
MLSLTTISVKTILAAPVRERETMIAKLSPSQRSATIAGGDDRESAEAARLDLGILDGHLGYFVRRLQVEIFQQFIAALAPFNVRPAQFSVLVLIESNPGRPQAAISRTLDIERAALAKMLHELERRGWIQRLPAADDRRSHALFLTHAGEQALAGIKELAQAHERQLERRLGAKRYRDLATLLKDFG